MKKISLLILLLVLCQPLFSLAEASVSKEEYPGLFDDLGKNLADSFAGANLFYHLGAVGVTFGLIETKTDREVQHFFQTKNPFGQTYSDIMLITGVFWHFVPGLFIYWNGLSSHDIEMTGAGAASCQAVLTSFLVIYLEKYLSGRKYPNKTDYSGFLNNNGWQGSQEETDFSFKFWEHNLNQGRESWPSGHTATAFAFVSALYAYYPEETAISWIGYPLALMMGISTIEGDYHWASDVAAGLLIGHVIGWTIGKNYRSRVDQISGKKSPEPFTLRILPVFNRQTQGLALSLQF